MIRLGKETIVDPAAVKYARRFGRTGDVVLTFLDSAATYYASCTEDEWFVFADAVIAARSQAPPSQAVPDATTANVNMRLLSADEIKRLSADPYRIVATENENRRSVSFPLPGTNAEPEPPVKFREWF